MTPYQFYRETPRKEILRVCQQAGTSHENFRHIACYNSNVSSRLAMRLEEASGGVMTLREILSPAEFDKQRHDYMPHQPGRTRQIKTAGLLVGSHV